ncbi:hypothetical protein Q5752_004935 [Cryptotrichosporon argae]
MDSTLSLAPTMHEHDPDAQPTPAASTSRFLAPHQRSHSPFPRDTDMGAPLSARARELARRGRDQDQETGIVPLELIGADDPKPDSYEVTFDGPDDPRNAQNWPLRRKVKNTALITLATLFAGVGSAIFSGASTEIAERFGVGQVVGELANSMFVIGFACGPQIFGPASEVIGRKWPLVIGCLLSAIFAIQVAGASNLATIMLGRFFGGVFGAAPYAIGGGIFHDLYDALHVQTGIAFFATATAGGPALGPVIGTGLASTSASYGWRWTEWFMLCFGMLTSVLLALFMDESFAPVILQRAAAERRHATRNWAWHAELDTVRVTPRDVVVRYILRPVKMLFSEPMLLVVTIYLTFVYSLLYGLMAAVPTIFSGYRGMTAVHASLPFLSVFVGILFGGGIIILDMHRYARVLKASGQESLPEQRFVPMGLGAVMLPIGLFWFAFTGPALVGSPWPSIIALGFSMCGMVLIFECGIIYLIDMYKSFANSAIAANTLARSLVGGGFPLFVTGMIRNLGWESTWAMALLAFIAVALAPIPLVFYHTGARIRALSRFSLEL